MENDKTVADLDEKQVNESDISKTDAETTDQNGESGREKSPYEVELERINAEKEEQIRQKNGALEEERRRRKEAEALIKKTDSETDKLTVEQIKEMVDARLMQNRFADKLDSITADPKEKELIKFHYENSIRHTGDVQADLANAVALANRHVIDEVKRNTSERVQTEARNAQFSRGGTYNRASNDAVPPRNAAAAQILKMMGAEDAIKHLE